MTRLLWWLLAVVACARALSGSCPSVCSCKWKGGKQTVECIDRALITIPENVNPETQVLDISGNNLQILPNDMFVRAGLLNLQKVYLRSCRIGQIDDRALHKLTNLVELDLSYNLLTSIPSKTFLDVHFLRDINLANNPILKIENNAFQSLVNLVKLDLSHCELHNIAPKAFEGVEQLELLKLNGNKLTELRPRTVDSLNRLHGVELHENPWVCDCKMRSVKLWLMDNNIPYPVSPTCWGGPERVLRKTFDELDVDDFACKPEILSLSRYVEANTGENATVMCRVNAIPQADVHWYWNGRMLMNNSAFNSHHLGQNQRVYIYEDGRFDMTSSLVITNAQETDSSEFYCVAENRAGAAEANFTLHVSLRTAGMSTLGSGQIAGLSVALVILILSILLVILFLLVRIRRLPFTESKTPSQMESNAAPGGDVLQVTANGKPAVIGNNCDTSFAERKAPTDTNPVQKPPRLTELSYSTSHYDGNGSVMSTAPVALPPKSANNPDLIRDTKGPPQEVNVLSAEVPNSSSDYPTQLESAEGSPDLFIRRTTSAGFNLDTSDKTPIIGSEEDYSCRTFPRYPPDYGLPIPSSNTTPPTAKTLRVWQKGVPVLPPVTALKRALSSSRNSPDEGYQEGCGTDV